MLLTQPSTEFIHGSRKASFVFTCCVKCWYVSFLQWSHRWPFSKQGLQCTQTLGTICLTQHFPPLEYNHVKQNPKSAGERIGNTLTWSRAGFPFVKYASFQQAGAMSFGVCNARLCAQLRFTAGTKPGMNIHLFELPQIQCLLERSGHCCELHSHIFSHLHLMLANIYILWKERSRQTEDFLKNKIKILRQLFTDSLWHCHSNV